MYLVLGCKMNKKKISLIVRNMELLVESLKLELEEDVKTETNTHIKFDDLIRKIDESYEPDYHEDSII
jgi:hypothetical protein